MRELYQQKILIVDDEPINISAIAEILGQKYALSVANNGEKALRILSEGLQPDLILLDILMPDIDGFEVAKQLKANPDTAAIPIIFLTAKKDNESIATGFKVGAVDYLSKPFQKEELLLRIKNTLQIFNLRNALNNALTESQKYIKTIESQMALIDKNIIFFFYRYRRKNHGSFQCVLQDIGISQRTAHRKNAPYRPPSGYESLFFRQIMEYHHP